MKSFGKSLGVRLAIGGATILSGVYAAALAQKDRQESSESWTAGVPSLGQPVTPIGGELPEPTTESGSETDSLAASAAAAFVQSDQGIDGSIQLVQHTEPISNSADGGFGLPASLNDGPTFSGKPTIVDPTSSDSADSVASPVAFSDTPPAFSDAPTFSDGPTFGDAPSTGAAPAFSEAPATAEAAGTGGSAGDSGAVPGFGPPSIDNEASADSASADGPGNWLMPSDTQPATAQASEAPAMTFPASDGPATMAAPVEAAPSAPAMGLPVELGPMADATTNPASAQPTGEQLQTPDMQVIVQDANTTAGTEPGTTDVGTVGFGAPVATAGETAAPAGIGFPSGPSPVSGAPVSGGVSPANDGPANLLRGDSTSSNVLRDGSAPAMAGPVAESTGPAMGFGTPAPVMEPAVESNPAIHQGQVQSNPAMSMSGISMADPSQPSTAYNTGVAPGPQNLNPSIVAAPTGYPAAAQPNARVASLPSQTQATGTYPRSFEQPAGALPIQSNVTFDAPGERRLEGVQTPSVVIHKRAPAEVKVGKPASFVIQVQNVGTVEALDVVVQDRIPAGMRLVDASPAPVQQGSLLMWEIGSMPAGDERTLTMQLVPEKEGELGSVARVSFEAAASVRTVATRPELKVSQRAPETVLIGQQLEIELEVSNPGTGQATGVVLQEDVPEGLEHPKGRQLDNALGDLAPGEIRKQVLRLRAVAPGIIQNTIRLSGDDGLAAEHTVAVQVVAPDLRVDLKGPSRRYLERQATYQLEIANAGTADATNVELSVQLARGFTFVSTDFEGQYDPSRHAVFWSLAQLPAGQSGTVPLTLLPVEAGEQAIVTDARADLGVTARNERTMSVEGFAELNFEITNPGGPIEVGAETVYQIRVSNKGSMADTNVRVQLQLPAGLELVSADSEAGTDGRGLVAFQPRSNLAPGDEVKYNLRLKGTSEGTHLVKAVVTSDQNKVPVTKEESTKVYLDN